MHTYAKSGFILAITSQFCLACGIEQGGTVNVESPSISQDSSSYEEDDDDEPRGSSSRNSSTRDTDSSDDDDDDDDQGWPWDEDDDTDSNDDMDEADLYPNAKLNQYSMRSGWGEIWHVVEPLGFDLGDSCGDGDMELLDVVFDAPAMEVSVCGPEGLITIDMNTASIGESRVDEIRNGSIEVYVGVFLYRETENDHAGILVAYDVGDEVHYYARPTRTSSLQGRKDKDSFPYESGYHEIDRDGSLSLETVSIITNGIMKFDNGEYKSFPLERVSTSLWNTD